MSISFSMCATRVNGTPEDKEKLPQIISAHKQWLEDHTKGRQACLREMNLEGADFPVSIFPMPTCPALICGT